MEKFFSDLFRNRGKAAALIEVGRPWNGALSGLLAVLAYALFGGQPAAGIVLFVVFTAAYMAGSTVNDIADHAIDIINMPYRPLQEGRLAGSAAKQFSIAMHLATLGMAFLLGPTALLPVLVFFALSVLYSVPPVQCSRRGIAGQIELSAVVVLVPLWAGAASALNTLIIPLSMFPFMLSFYLLGVFVLLLKDFKDVNGDAEGNKTTAVIQLGTHSTQTLSMAGTLLSFTAVLFSMNTFTAYSFIPSLGILLALLYAENSIVKAPEAGYSLARALLLLFVGLLIAVQL